MTTWPTQYALARSLLKGHAVTVFDAATTSHGTQTVEHFKLVCQTIQILKLGFGLQFR